MQIFSQDFVRRLMNPDPKKRPTALEAMKHPWISGDAASSRNLKYTQRILSEYNLKRQFAVRTTYSYILYIIQLLVYMIGRLS